MELETAGRGDFVSQTKIEWADAVWNPVTGCTKISPGCQNCYAERMSKRLAGRCGYPEDEPFKVTLHPERLHEPSRLKKPRRIFVNSMSDLFHEDVPDSFIRDIFWRIWFYRQHTFLVLTKRPERIAGKGQCSNCGYLAPVGNDEECPNYGVTEKYMHDQGFAKIPRDWPKNLWLGVTAENQEMADKRIPLLLQTPAAIRFVSVEPMLGPVDLSNIWEVCPECGSWEIYEPRGEMRYCDDCGVDVPKPKIGIDWVICGGETGPGARPMHPDWVRSLRDQCQAAGVPFLFKQFGEWTPDLTNYHSEPLEPFRVRWMHPDGTVSPIGSGLAMGGSITIYHIGKKKAGRLLDGREWDEFPKGAS